jgi:hypothetical protein
MASSFPDDLEGSRNAACRVLGMRDGRDARACHLTSVRLGASSNARCLVESAAPGRSGGDALRPADVDSWSGSPLVLVDESPEDVATDNGTAARRDQMRDRLGELQATVWSRLVVADVLVEHRFEMKGAKISIAPDEGSLHLRILDRWCWMPSYQGRVRYSGTSMSESGGQDVHRSARPLMFGIERSLPMSGLTKQPRGSTREQGRRARRGVGREETGEFQRSLYRRAHRG